MFWIILVFLFWFLSRGLHVMMALGVFLFFSSSFPGVSFDLYKYCMTPVDVPPLNTKAAAG